MVDGNCVIIDEGRIEASGRLSAEQNALHELKSVISSLVDSVRGGDELVITCEIRSCKDGKVAKGQSAKDSSALSPKAGTKDAGKGKSEKGGSPSKGKPAKQEVDPLSDMTGGNK